MNKAFIFFLSATLIVVFCTVVLNTGPIITEAVGTEWKNINCIKAKDDYDISKEDWEKETDEAQKASKEKIAKSNKKKIDRCHRKKGMYGLEYASFIIDIIVGIICSLLGLLHYLDEGKSFEKKTGLIGLIAGVLGFIITLIYIIFSGLVYTNYSSTYKTDENGIIAKWDNTQGAYICTFYDEEDEDAVYAKYSELGKKQYNYNKDNYLNFNFLDEEKKGCNIENNNIKCQSNKKLAENSNIISKKTYLDGSKDCENIYLPNEGIENKYLNDKWLTTIIFSVLIVVCFISLSFFGFLLFRATGESGEVKTI